MQVDWLILSQLFVLSRFFCFKIIEPIGQGIICVRQCFDVCFQYIELLLNLLLEIVNTFRLLRLQICKRRKGADASCANHTVGGAARHGHIVWSRAPILYRAVAVAILW